MTDFAFRAPDPGLGDLRFPMDISIPNDVRYIEHIVGAVVQRCVELDLAPRACRLNVPVALTEALSNAILRGNGDDPSKHVRLRASMDEIALVMEVEDEGTGFDLNACVVEPREGDNLDREDGRGLFLMRSLMDRVEMVSAESSVVRLTLHRT